MDRLGEAIDAVVIPVGGGGLLAGMAATLKHLCPEITVIVRFTKLFDVGCSTHSLELTLLGINPLLITRCLITLQSPFAVVAPLPSPFLSSMIGTGKKY